MKINKLKVENFRNYALVNLSFTKNINIFYGCNAQGKTSLLEAVYYLSLLSSHRSNNESELLRHEQTAFAVAAEYKNTYQVVNCKVKRDYLAKKRECFINEAKAASRDYVGELKTVMFSPEDLKLIKGEPQIRRRFIDIRLSQHNKYYYKLLVNYKNILKQRNSLLKLIKEGKAKKSSLAVWDIEFAKTAAEIIKLRMDFIHAIEQKIISAYSFLAGEDDDVVIKYIHFAEDMQIDILSENILDKLNANFTQDIIRGNTSIGPHKDDIQIFLGGYNANKFASQGQQRMLTLAFKMAEINYSYDKSGEYPILLLDDVVSELDELKKNKLFKIFSEDIQVFITVTEKSLLPDHLLSDANASFFQVINGEVCGE